MKCKSTYFYLHVPGCGGGVGVACSPPRLPSRVPFFLLKPSHQYISVALRLQWRQKEDSCSDLIFFSPGEMWKRVFQFLVTKEM